MEKILAIPPGDDASAWVARYVPENQLTAAQIQSGKWRLWRTDCIGVRWYERIRTSERSVSIKAVP